MKMNDSMLQEAMYHIIMPLKMHPAYIQSVTLMGLTVLSVFLRTVLTRLTMLHPCHI